MIDIYCYINMFIYTNTSIYKIGVLVVLVALIGHLFTLLVTPHGAPRCSSSPHSAPRCSRSARNTMSAITVVMGPISLTQSHYISGDQLGG